VLAVRRVRRARAVADATAPASEMPSCSICPAPTPCRRATTCGRPLRTAGRRVVDLRAREHRVHAERAVLVRGDRHDPLADLGVLHPVLEQPHHGHRRGDGVLARALLHLGVHRVAGSERVFERTSRLAASHPAGGAGRACTRSPASPRPGGRTARRRSPRRRARCSRSLIGR
jgi:hypothetical protein